jgi:hypothetical protein
MPWLWLVVHSNSSSDVQQCAVAACEVDAVVLKLMQLISIR